MNRLTQQAVGGSIRFAGTVTERAFVTIESLPASVTAGNLPQIKPRFELDVPATAIQNPVSITATDLAGNSQTNDYILGTVSGTAKSFTYDDNGNLCAENAPNQTCTDPNATRTYEWDAENRLIAVKQGQNTLASFTYDGKGRRSTKTAGGVTTSYVYDRLQVIEERTSSGGTTRYFFGNGVDDVLAKQDSMGSFYYVKDHLGSVRQATNASGTVVSMWEYDPWGNPSQGSMTSGFFFTGREWDSEIGLYFYRARYYDPTVGRFLSADPIFAEESVVFPGGRAIAFFLERLDTQDQRASSLRTFLSSVVLQLDGRCWRVEETPKRINVETQWHTRHFWDVFDFGGEKLVLIFDRYGEAYFFEVYAITGSKLDRRTRFKFGCEGCP